MPDLMNVMKILQVPTEQQSSAPFFSPGGVPGMTTPGNINLFNRPTIPNPQAGGMSTVFSTSFVDEDPKSPTFGQEVLVPRAADGKILSEEEAKQRYYRTRELMGGFRNATDATTYAQQVHKGYESGKYGYVPPTTTGGAK
jgi:hypothetical protein